MGFWKNDRHNYNHNCSYLALQPGGLSDINLQQIILTFRNEAVHTCDVSNVCDVLITNIQLIQIKDDGKSRVEHHGKDYGENM